MGLASLRSQTRGQCLEGSWRDLRRLGHFVRHLHLFVRRLFDDLGGGRRCGRGLGGCAGRCVGVGAHGKCTNDQSGKDLFHTLTFLGF